MGGKFFQQKYEYFEVTKSASKLQFCTSKTYLFRHHDFHVSKPPQVLYS